MNQREQLIEDAAKAMYFEDCGVAAVDDDAEPFREMAEAALAVFEGAYTRTDDGDGTGEELPCQECGARNPVWWAAHSYWNLAVGGDPSREAGGILCPSCFHGKWLTATGGTPTDHHVDHHDDAPTDDEREALALVHRMKDSAGRRQREEWCYVQYKDVLALEERLTAPHRTVQGEPPSVEEWAARAHSAREKAIAKGYTPEHDAEHGVRHLLNWAIDYARRGRAEGSSGLILSAMALLDAPQGEPSDDYEAGYAEGFHHGRSTPREPLSEQSDAQVKAALVAFYGEAKAAHMWDRCEDLRAALRAAAEAGGER